MRILYRNTRRSERGASITFALLLFLVCAVVGSVVLTAGTAASGRASKLSEMDQRFYCVSSVASLLHDCLDNQTATFVQESTVTLTRTTKYEGGRAITTTDTGAPETGELTRTASAEQLKGLLLAASEALLPYQTVITTEEDAAVTALPVKNFSLTLSGSGLDGSALEASVTQKTYTDGTVIFTVKNRNGEPYTLSLLFQLDRSDTTDRSEKTYDPVVSNEDGYTVTRRDETTVKTTTTFRWTLREVQAGEIRREADT